MSDRSMIFTVLGLSLACLALLANWRWSPLSLERRITAIERRPEAMEAK